MKDHICELYKKENLEVDISEIQLLIFSVRPETTRDIVMEDQPRVVNLDNTQGKNFSFVENTQKSEETRLIVDCSKYLKALDELINTEKDYLTDLCTIQQLYIVPLSKSNFF